MEPLRTPLYLVGDVHGDWKAVHRQLTALPPGIAITIGDHDLYGPYRKAMEPALKAGHQVFWLPGNHDLEHGYDHLWGDYPEGNLSGKLKTIGGWRIAALGGVFRGRLWWPKDDMDEVRYAPSARRTPRQLRPILGEFGERALLEAVRPDDYDRLARQRADILLTHEAPLTHKHGFFALEMLGAELRAQWHIHGHHHRDYAGVTSFGVSVKGLAKAEVWEVPQ